MEYHFIKSDRRVSTTETRFFVWKKAARYSLVPTEHIVLNQEAWLGRWHPFEIYKKLISQLNEKFFDFHFLYSHEENKTYLSYAVLPECIKADILPPDAIVTGLPWLVSEGIRKFSQHRIYTIAYVHGTQLEFAFFRSSLLSHIFYGPASDPIRTWARFTQSVPMASAGMLQCISVELWDSLKPHHRDTYLIKTENIRHGKLILMLRKSL